MIKEKDVVEEVATIEENGSMIIATNGSMVDNIDCSIDKCNNTTSSERYKYTAEGVMVEAESKEFQTGELTENIDRATTDEMLYIPRQAFDPRMFRDKFTRRTLVTRDKLDTARYICEDQSGVTYNSIVPLNQEYGLRDMNTNGLFADSQKGMEIQPLSAEEIDAMLKREDPKVAQGLMAYAADRENYYYNSNDDEYFVCEGMEQAHHR